MLKKSARLRWSIGTGNRLCRREGGVCATALAAATFVVYQPPLSIHAIHAPMTLPVEISLHFLLSLPCKQHLFPAENQTSSDLIVVLCFNDTLVLCAQKIHNA